MRIYRITGLRRLLVTIAIAMCFPAWALGAETPTETEAIWKRQQISFEYRGYSTFYTCGGLRRKLRSILTGLGARDTIRLNGYACDDVTGRAHFDIILESPIVATEDNVNALTTYSAEQQLVARVRGDILPSAADLERFPAAWETVSFSRNPRMGLDAGDCELVEQLLRSILPRLSVQIVDNSVRCSPFGNMRPPRLTVLALMAQQTDRIPVRTSAAP
jgi:hypothetical protein